MIYLNNYDLISIGYVSSYFAHQTAKTLQALETENTTKYIFGASLDIGIEFSFINFIKTVFPGRGSNSEPYSRRAIKQSAWKVLKYPRC